MASPRQTREETLTDFENSFRDLIHTFRKQVDAELKYVRKARSLRWPWAAAPAATYKHLQLIRRESFSGDSSNLESLLQQLKDRSVGLLHLVEEANHELRKLLLIELPYEIDDFIDVIIWKGSVKKSGAFKVMSLGYGRARWRRLELEIQSILDRLAQQAVASPHSPKAVSPSRTTVLMEEDNKFLVPDQKEVIKRRLLLSDSSSSSSSSSSGPPIVVVWGPGGMGKTSLVKKLYNEDIEIRRQFVCFAWVEMPEDFQAGNVMQSILEQLMPSMAKKRVAEMSVVELIGELHSVQKQKKCLIVLSGVQRKENWGMLTVAFPTAEYCTKSKILLTTDRRDFAQEIGEAHQIKPLHEKESWELFMSKTDIILDENTKKLLMKIVSLCKGSRLAIAIVTGYFNSIDISLSDWDSQFADELKSHLREEENDLEQIVRDVVDFSYSKLSHEIQDCFLYLGHFPVEREIQVDDLYIMWIDEGLISSQSDEDPMQVVAVRYLEELFQKNLVQAVDEEEEEDGRRSKSCKLHPLVREFCIVEAEKEELYKVMPSRGNRVGSVRSLVRRLSINTKSYEDGSSSRECAKASPRLRSLFVFGTFEPQPDIGELELLRVLEFNGVDFRGWDLPKGIGGELICLRYLSFKRCYLEKLPVSIGELTHLKTLDLRVESGCVVSIPNVLWKLRELKRLYLPARFECIVVVDDKIIGSGRLSLRGLKDLEVLVNFNTLICDALDLGVMKKLQRVGAIVEENHKHLEIILEFAKVVFTALRYFSIEVVNFNCFHEDKRSVLAKLLDSRRVSSLRLEGYIKKLPVHHMRSIQNLTEIVLSSAELEDDPMPVFGEIPNLRSLTLSSDACVRKKLDCLETGFSQLRTLKLKNLRNLEAWDVEEGTMPQLMSLSVNNCGKLAMLPVGLKYLNALRELRVVSMPKEFEKRVQVVEGIEGEDVCKVNHVPRIIIVSST